MANWYGHARSNYFKVKDEDKFKAWVESFGCLRLIESADGFGFYSEEPDSGGWPSVIQNPETGEWDYVDIVTGLVEHLAEGQVAVLMEVGAEKMRYLTGHAVAVAWDGRMESVTIADIYQKASEAFGVTPTPAEY